MYKTFQKNWRKKNYQPQLVQRPISGCHLHSIIGGFQSKIHQFPAAEDDLDGETSKKKSGRAIIQVSLADCVRNLGAVEALVSWLQGQGVEEGKKHPWDGTVYLPIHEWLNFYGKMQGTIRLYQFYGCFGIVEYKKHL